MAADSGRVEVVKSLVESGASPSVENKVRASRQKARHIVLICYYLSVRVHNQYPSKNRVRTFLSSFFLLLKGTRTTTEIRS